MGMELHKVFEQQKYLPRTWQEAIQLYFQLLNAVKTEKNLKIVNPELYKALFFPEKSPTYDRAVGFIKDHNIYDTKEAGIIIAQEGDKVLLYYSRDTEFPEDGKIKHHGRCINFYDGNRSYKRFGIYEEEGKYSGVYPYYQQNLYYADYWPVGEYQGNPRMIQSNGYETTYYNPDGSRELFGGITSLFQELFG